MTKTKKSGFLLLYVIVAVLLIAVSLSLHFLFNTYFLHDETEASGNEGTRSVILDAGHGGYDGGAVSVTGTAEKVLNLDTTLTLGELLHLQGYHVILTRDSDTELTSDNGGSRKMQDLRGRLDIAEEHSGVPFISIHMNKFPQSKYRGLQVYYAVSEASGKDLAAAVQETVKEFLQPENERQIKPATSAIYLLDRIRSPAVLIECGFLSNPEEAALLEDVDYRLRLCLSVAVAFHRWQEAPSLN